MRSYERDTTYIWCLVSDRWQLSWFGVELCLWYKNVATQNDMKVWSNAVFFKWCPTLTLERLLSTHVLALHFLVLVHICCVFQWCLNIEMTSHSSVVVLMLHFLELVARIISQDKKGRELDNFDNLRGFSVPTCLEFGWTQSLDHQPPPFPIASGNQVSLPRPS